MAKFFFILLLPLPLFAFSATTLEAYGDSLTAGYFADTNLTKAPPLSRVSELMTALATFAITRDPKIIDSFEHHEFAWPALFAARMKIPNVENYSRSSMHSSDLFRQVSQTAAHNDARAAFFFIGHNDLKPPFDVDVIVSQFIGAYGRALLEWDRRHENSTAYILPVGDVPQVYEVLRDYVWYESPKKFHYSCEDSWERFFPYGRALALMQHNGTLRNQLAPLIEQMNRELENLTHVVLPAGSTNRIRFLHYLSPIQFKPEYFAIDCYHLSGRGQQYLSDVLTETAATLGD